MRGAPDNTWDVIDSRDVIERIEELEEEREPLIAARQEARERFYGLSDDHPEGEATYNVMLAAEEALDEWEHSEELEALTALADEASDYAPDWQHGEALIRDSYFVEYAQDLANDIGYTTQDVHWPHTHIDWESASDELKQDYSAVDFDGVTYWVR